jgi:hypothetical protein
MSAISDPYPVTLSIDFPDRPLNRLTSFFRIFTVIPIAIVIGLLIGAHTQWEAETDWVIGAGTGSLVVFSLLLMILFRQKYPRWWFDWNLELTRFSTRVVAYLLLMRDEYPSTDEEQYVHFNMKYPDVKTELDQWLPLVKWFLAIPHYIVLACMDIAVVVCVIIAWFAILFTTRYPRDLFAFVEGVIRWELRVMGYAFFMVTDKYPPFDLEERESC